MRQPATRILLGLAAILSLLSPATPPVFAQGKVALLVGDWTGGDAAIGRLLESQGRSGVALYIHYAPGKATEILPKLIAISRIVSLAREED